MRPVTVRTATLEMNGGVVGAITGQAGSTLNVTGDFTPTAPIGVSKQLLLLVPVILRLIQASCLQDLPLLV
jgi:hypothetical protein